MENVNLKINGLSVTAPAGSTILEAAQAAGIRIPTLCYLKEINEIGACRMCVVEVKGARNLVAACVYPVSEGMEVQTNTKKLLFTSSGCTATHFRSIKAEASKMSTKIPAM